MALPILISDRLTAAGFRLAGLRPLVTAPEDAGAVFREALALGGPVIITAALAAHVPAAQLEKAIRAADPPVAVIPDIVRSAEPADMGELVRRALGVEA
jgi:vacuolar-type H+-ATPase subunit F/Vma7